MGHLADEDRACRTDLLDHFEHIKALGYKPKDALAQLVREAAFTHLNRLCAYKMMEAREVYVGGQKFREAVSRGLKSQGFLFYLAEHPEDEKRYNSGHQDVAYRHFLDWLGGTLSEEIGVLFSPTDPANRLYPPQRVLDQVLDLLKTGDIKAEEKELQKRGLRSGRRTRPSVGFTSILRPRNSGIRLPRKPPLPAIPMNEQQTNP